MDAQIGHNLRRLRDAAKLTQAQVAERAQLSRVAYGNIESGSAQPRVETLIRIAEVFGVKLQDLLNPSRPLQAVRFRALKRMTSREQVLVNVVRWLEDYNELEEMLNERIKFRFDRLVRDLDELPPGIERARIAADRARHSLGLDPDASIRDICGLLEERGGVKVYPMPLASDAFFGLSVAKDDGGPAVVVNVWDRISVERWIFTAAHELGHLLLHLGAYNVAESVESREEEEEANQFASHFLMPQEMFTREWNEGRGLSLVDRVLKVKRIFRVSYRTVLYRLSEQEVYGKAIWQLFQRSYKARFGQSLLKSDEPQALPPRDFNALMVEPRAAGEPKRLAGEDFIDDRLHRLVRSAVEKELISLGRAAEILDINLKSMRAITASWVE